MLCEGYPRQFLVYMRTVRQLEFAQDPDVCICLFIRMRGKENYRNFSMMVYVDYFIMHSMKIILLMMVILIG
jgi:hypothetical protein